MTRMRPDLSRLIAGVVGVVSAVGWLCAAVPAAGASAEPTRWDFQLTVNAPASAGDAFDATFTATLVGARPGIWLQPPLSLTYGWAVTGPDGHEPPLRASLPRWTTQQAQLTGTVLHDHYIFAPDQNGSWIFRVFQLEDGKEKLLIERQVVTDKAFIAPSLLSEPAPSSAAQTAQPATRVVTGIGIDPPQPVVGQPATISVQVGNDPLAQALSELPVNLIDDEGLQPLGVVSLSGGSGTLVWVPQHPTDHGQLQVGDQLMPIVVVDAPPGPAPADDTDTAPTTDDEDAE
jgi:hypothetical protein